MNQQQIALLLLSGSLIGLACGSYFKPRAAPVLAGVASTMCGAYLTSQEQRKEQRKDLEAALKNYRTADGYDPDVDARILQIMRSENEQ